ncbi:MAG: trehalose-6-phosphate synthase [Anaerolineales bacterium]
MTDCLEESSSSRRPIIIASNRGPVTFQKDENGELSYHRASGGLVTALTGMASQIDATWISCGSTTEDKVWSSGAIPLSEEGSHINIRFLAPPEETYLGYYNVISNPLLWFLQHSMWDLPHAPVINKKTWSAWDTGYTVINRIFAEAIIQQLSTISGLPLVMLQDYHLYLVANFIRQKLPARDRPTILHFIHIPWPGPEYWRILPPAMRHAILEGLCAVDLLGFQTHEDGLNFIRTCESYLPRASVNYKRGRIWYRNHATYVRDFPISIDVDAIKKLADSREVFDYESEIHDMVGSRKMILRIDRIEPSKNIVRGFQAFEEMLDLYPEHREKVTFLALLVPSRLEVEEYRDYLDVLMAAAGKVNAKYGSPDWEPVRVVVSENYPRAVAALKKYDALLVNAIADGMNLVAKEGPIVNQNQGVLILSERAGARQQLESGAIVISPCDIYATAEAIHQALKMPMEQRENNSEKLRWLIEREDINDWLCKQLDAVSELGL